ncbi:TIGR04086 family membrane protein [Robertmurraya siralis]|uniref:TIGR04086 family membrane protein n=1 Tax=Robertmurraya siralis TaxID=77777 RepID=UPI002AA5316F|nr:TIGR04086 family membrane protein [Robertmurraya siralis]
MLYGVIGIFLLLIIASFVFSVILRFTNTQESSLGILTTIISFITLFAGGFITGRKGKEKGWLIGALTGAIYTLIIFLFQYLGYDSLFSLEQIVYHVCYILTAMMGGILGVNMSSPKTRSI